MKRLQQTVGFPSCCYHPGPARPSRVIRGDRRLDDIPSQGVPNWAMVEHRVGQPLHGPGNGALVLLGPHRANVEAPVDGLRN